jgi:hypothetical protein
MVVARSTGSVSRSPSMCGSDAREGCGAVADVRQDASQPDPVLAEQLGLVAEALAYEQQELNRPSVVAKLTELVSHAQAVDDASDLLTAA